MVKVGFIVEGDSEKIVVESVAFQVFLQEHGFELVTPVINAKGGGNLLPQNIEVFIERLRLREVERIVVLTDLEDEPSIDTVKQRISNAGIDTIFVAVKALEAWFIADSTAMGKWLNDPNFREPLPESTSGKPWDRLKEIARDLDKRGPGNKTAFAKRITKTFGFRIDRAAQHDECPSAKILVEYFTQ